MCFICILKVDKGCQDVFIISTYYFCFFRHPSSAIHRHTWFPVISRKSIYPIYTKFGMGVYWVNSLHGIAFGEDSSIAN